MGSVAVHIAHLSSFASAISFGTEDFADGHSCGWLTAHAGAGASVSSVAAAAGSLRRSSSASSASSAGEAHLMKHRRVGVEHGERLKHGHCAGAAGVRPSGKELTVTSEALAQRMTCAIYAQRAGAGASRLAAFAG